MFKGNTPLDPTRELNSVLNLKHFFSEIRLRDEEGKLKLCPRLLGHSWRWITGLSGTMRAPFYPSFLAIGTEANCRVPATSHRGGEGLYL
jgi:hypothetical protein